MLKERKKIYSYLKGKRIITTTSEEDWINKWFADESKTNQLFDYLSKKKYYTDSRQDFYKKYACDLDWAKKLNYCGGDESSSVKDEYVGSYKTETTPEENFEIIKKSGEYFVSARGENVKIVKTTGDNFEIESKIPPASGTISFKRDSNNKVTGGSADVKVGIGFLSKELKGTFTRIGVTPSPETETKKTAQYDFTPWTCINNFNESWGYYKLLGGWDGVNKYAYEYTSHKVNGRKVKLLYFDNQKVVMRFEDDDSDVSGGTGKWECNTDGTGYTIRWDNGQIAVFNKTKGEVSKDSLPNITPDEDSKDSKSPKSEGTSQLPKYKDVCKSTISCPNRKDVEAGKTSYKLCMKCAEIQEFQNNPVLKVIYFKKLKENGFKEKTDGVFGPITKAAVEEYQEMNGLVKDGLIGIKTLAQLDKDKSGRKE